MSAGDFAGKAVIVTGAASGLGRAAALAFAQAGAALALADVDADGLDETGIMAGAAGAFVHLVPLDIADAAACRRFVEEAAHALGRLDAIVNVAGVARIRHVADITAEEWDWIFAVNVRGPFFLIQAALPHLITSEGAVLNVASSAAFLGHSYLAPYAASKAALVNLTKSLAVEHAHTNVHINAIAPGGMTTPMTDKTVVPPDVDETLMARYFALRGMTAPEELTELMLFLASPRGKIAHGACFNVDRGITAG